MNKQPVKVANMDWPWKAENHGGSIILVSDEQFTNLANRPDEAVEKPAPWFEKPVSLREYCQELAHSGGTKIHIAYDYFFGGSTRGLYPDTPAFLENLKKIYDVAREYGLGIEPSVLSPLELGVGYRAKTGEFGRWMQYGEGLRDPVTGRYSVMLWQHIQWVNNKGPTPVELVSIRVFAFREQLIPNSIYFSVNPDEMIELPTPQIEAFPGTRPIHYGAPEVGANESRRFQAHRIRIFGESDLPKDPDSKSDQNDEFDRILVVLVYHTVEMDYFSPSAGEFVNNLMQEIHDRKIELEGIYSDEMHIQQDWIYHHHMDYGQFTVRYVSPGFEQAFAQKYGRQYADFAPWLVYFTCHQHHFLATHEPKLPSQHVFGNTPEDIAATQLFRRNYYHFLEKGIVDLMNMGREKIEGLQAKPIDAFYHATWAESPTCDIWSVAGVQKDWSPEEHRSKYEYTPEFLWSNTVQQASAACANYFAWNEFLTGGNNDIPEGGYADRNYYGRAVACSLAALNRQPLASCGMWGMPEPVAERMAAVSQAFGAGGHPIFRSVGDYAPRQVDVLFVYPQDLVAVEERFGSWMVQYGYANLITAEKLVQYGVVEVSGKDHREGCMTVNGWHYRAVCVLFEPFPSTELLDLLETFVKKAGIVVWSAVPPRLMLDGNPMARSRLEELFGVHFIPTLNPDGLALPGRTVQFSGTLESVQPMTVLTDFLVDRVYPIQSAPGVAGIDSIASVRTGGNSPVHCVGTRRIYPGGGQAVYLGFRPRDDQSASTGSETRTWFEILHALGAYPDSGYSHDNPSTVSRMSDYLACQFPNGALAVAPHYRWHEENWPGGFFRDAEIDRKSIETIPPPDDEIHLQDFCLSGQKINFDGRHCLAWNLNEAGRLIAFAGLDCSAITINGQTFRWSDQPVEVAWHPLSPEQAVEGFRPLFRVWCGTITTLRLPLGLENTQNAEEYFRLEVYLGARLPRARTRRGRPRSEAVQVGYARETVPFQLDAGQLVLDVSEEIVDHWLYVVEKI